MLDQHFFGRTVTGEDLGFSRGVGGMAKDGILKKYQRGDPFGRQGVESVKKRVSAIL